MRSEKPHIKQNKKIAKPNFLTNMILKNEIENKSFRKGDPKK